MGDRQRARVTMRLIAGIYLGYLGYKLLFGEDHANFSEQPMVILFAVLFLILAAVIVFFAAKELLALREAQIVVEDDEEENEDAESAAAALQASDETDTAEAIQSGVSDCEKRNGSAKESIETETIRVDSEGCAHDDTAEDEASIHE